MRFMFLVIETRRVDALVTGQFIRLLGHGLGTRVAHTVRLGLLTVSTELSLHLYYRPCLLVYYHVLDGLAAQGPGCDSRRRKPRRRSTIQCSLAGSDRSVRH